MHKSPTYRKKVQYTYIAHVHRQVASPIYATDAISANLARELHNYSNRESVHCLDVYIRSLFMSSFRFTIHFWYLRLFYSDGFPCFIAPAFSTPAFSAPPWRPDHCAGSPSHCFRRSPWRLKPAGVDPSTFTEEFQFARLDTVKYRARFDAFTIPAFADMIVCYGISSPHDVFQ